MTGFGAAQEPVGGGILRVEIRSVNHRFFTLAARLPPELAGIEADLRDRLRKEFERGAFSVLVRWISPPSSTNGAVDPARARQAVARLRQIQAAAGIEGEIPLELLLRQPELGSDPEGTDATAEWSAVEPVVATAARECGEARRREGAVLARELDTRLAALGAEAERVRNLAPAHAVAERDRLRQAVARLLEGRPLDEARLAQEIALLAERHDLTEELVRLEAHLEACRETLRSAGAVGKRLGFLAQEIGREVNTIGSKANDVAIQHGAVAMKGELERFREQLENLE
ncbi:MAG TPA: YicC/YloC family endoribonuclease [Gemmatimonadales bacterium]|nr:YicC/YloC family endoribonuclease [Gemmatimonadales bacterium]